MSPSDDANAAWMSKSNKSVYDYSSSIITNEDVVVELVTMSTVKRSEMMRLDKILDLANVKWGQVLLYDKDTYFSSRSTFVQTEETERLQDVKKIKV